jgi:glutamine synthetase adenylyltransferase
VTGPTSGISFDKLIQRWSMSEDQPVMTALAEITAVSLLHSDLPAREHMVARLAALVAVDAPTASYVMNASTVEDVQSLLVAVAPIVGTARVVTAAERITEALGFVIELAVAEIVAELEAEDAAAETADRR